MSKGLDEVWSCANTACLARTNDGSKLSWIVCGICEKTFDTKCQGIEDKNFKALSLRADFFWLCKTCMLKHVISEGKIELDSSSNQIEIRDSVKDMDEKIEALLKKNSMVVDELKEIKNSLGVVEKSVEKEGNMSEELTQIISQSQTKWSDIVKHNINEERKVTVEHVKKALTEISDSDKESELRSRGIVIYNAEEKKVASSAVQKNADIKLIEKLLKTLGCENSTINEAFRMGRFDESRIEAGRFRPIKLRLSLSSDRDRVLKSLYKLKNADPELAKLSIREDLSLHQRNELNEKLKEAKSLTQNSTDKIFRVRGSPGNYRIIELAKKSVRV